MESRTFEASVELEKSVLVYGDNFPKSKLREYGVFARARDAAAFDGPEPCCRVVVLAQNAQHIKRISDAYAEYGIEVEHPDLDAHVAGAIGSGTTYPKDENVEVATPAPPGHFTDKDSSDDVGDDAPARKPAAKKVVKKVAKKAVTKTTQR